MGRKKGSKPTTQPLVDQQTLEMAVKTGKTQQQIAEELGIHRSTVSERINRALTAVETKQIIDTSRDRLIRMLSRCDEAYHDCLSNTAPENIGHRTAVATRIYKTFGLIQDEPQVRIQNIVPIQVVIKDGEHEREYQIGPASRDDLSTSETG